MFKFVSLKRHNKNGNVDNLEQSPILQTSSTHNPIALIPKSPINQQHHLHQHHHQHPANHTFINNISDNPACNCQLQCDLQPCATCCSYAKTGRFPGCCRRGRCAARTSCCSTANCSTICTAIPKSHIPCHARHISIILPNTKRFCTLRQYLQCVSCPSPNNCYLTSCDIR